MLEAVQIDIAPVGDDCLLGNKSGAVDRDCFLRMKRQSGWSDHTLVRVP